MRKLNPPVAALLACAAVSAALSAALLHAAAPRNIARAIVTQRALAIERPADSGVENDLGSLLVLVEDFAGAEQAYRRAIELDPENASAYFNLGLLQQKLGQRRDALKSYKRTLELEPRHAWAHYQEGTIYHAQGRDSAAKKAYAKALAVDPALGNPEVNPHLIENDLATSAMLYSYRHYREELLPAKEFEEPARIAGVLIDRPVDEGMKTEAAAQPAGEEEGGFARGAGAPHEGGAAAAAAAEAAEADPGVDPATQPDREEPPARVLTSKDLDPSSTSNQIGGGTIGSAASKPTGGRITSTTRGRTREVQAAPTRPTLRGPQRGGTPPPPASFLPTSDSTGRMEVHLVEIDEWS